MQGGVVAKPQVFPEPDDNRGGGGWQGGTPEWRTESFTLLRAKPVSGLGHPAASPFKAPKRALYAVKRRSKRMPLSTPAGTERG